MSSEQPSTASAWPAHHPTSRPRTPRPGMSFTCSRISGVGPQQDIMQEVAAPGTLQHSRLGVGNTMLPDAAMGHMLTPARLPRQNHSIDPQAMRVAAHCPSSKHPCKPPHLLSPHR